MVWCKLRSSAEHPRQGKTFHSALLPVEQPARGWVSGQAELWLPRVWVTVFEWVRPHQMSFSLCCIPVHLWGKMFELKGLLVTPACLCVLFPEVRLLKLLHMQCTKFFCALVPTWKWEQLKTWPVLWMLRVMRRTLITALKILWSLNVLSVWSLFQKSLYCFLSSFDKLLGFYKAAIVSL